MSPDTHWKLRRTGAPCLIPFADGVVCAGREVTVPRGHGFEVEDSSAPGGFRAADGWAFVPFVTTTSTEQES